MVMYQQPQNANRQMVNPSNPHNPHNPNYPQGYQQAVDMKDEVKKTESKTKYDESDIMSLCDDITSMYFCYEHVNEKLSVYVRPMKTENGKYRFNHKLSKKYKKIRYEIEKEVADHMDYAVNYEKLPMPTIEKYDLKTTKGHADYWNKMLANERHMMHELIEYADILLKSGTHTFYSTIVFYMKIHKENIMRIKCIIAFLEQYDYADWALAKVNKELHDEIEENDDLDLSL